MDTDDDGDLVISGEGAAPPSRARLMLDMSDDEEPYKPPSRRGNPYGLDELPSPPAPVRRAPPPAAMQFDPLSPAQQAFLEEFLAENSAALADWGRSHMGPASVTAFALAARLAWMNNHFTLVHPAKHLSEVPHWGKLDDAYRRHLIPVRGSRGWFLLEVRRDADTVTVHDQRIGNSDVACDHRDALAWLVGATHEPQDVGVTVRHESFVRTPSPFDSGPLTCLALAALLQQSKPRLGRLTMRQLHKVIAYVITMRGRQPGQLDMVRVTEEEEEEPEEEQEQEGVSM